jgi:4-hydroxybenzoate polyprenyltransferase
MALCQADRIKEMLGWLKVVFAALVAVDISLIAWLAQNFQSADTVLVVLAFVAVVCTTAAIVGANHAAYKRIAELEDL